MAQFFSFTLLICKIYICIILKKIKSPEIRKEYFIAFQNGRQRTI